MNPSDRIERDNGDRPPNRPLDRLCEEFEVAWRASLESGRRPILDSFLNRAPTSERAALQLQLREIELRCQQQSATAVVRKVDIAKRVADERYATDQAPLDGASPNVTIDAPPPADANATLNVAGETDPDVTVDPVFADRVAATTESEGFVAALRERADGETKSTPAEGKSPAQVQKTIDLGQEVHAPGALTTDFSASQPAEEEFKQQNIAGYTVLGELGRGGMGVVYKARQTQLNRVVALKMVLAGAHAGPEQLARFQIEAEAVAHLKHPNIVQIYEVGKHEDLPYFSLEYVDGKSLSRRIGGKPQPPGDAARMVERLADAMDSAHRKGIIHRDLKPANVLLTSDGEPKITDFGLAKRLEGDSGQTRSGTLMGTPNYMAPEQAHGDTKHIGPSSDLYALGVILYEMLTGRPPFQGTTILETLDMVQKQEPVPPRRLQPTVPRDLETICLKCLQKEPQKRYATAGSLGADLLRYLGGEPILARRVSPVERAWRWCKRNPKVAGLSGTVALLLVTVLVFLASARSKAAREQEVIAKERELAENRLEQAAAVIRVGDQRQAQALLDYTNPLLENTEQLRDVRDRIAELRSQVRVYSEFKKLVDDARFASRFGSRRRKQQAQQQCRQLVALHRQINDKTGEAAAGLPPLGADQEQLFKEDVFEAYLISAKLEVELAKDGRGRIAPDAARRAIDWLNLADAILPNTRVVHADRAPCWAAVGDAKADEQDVNQAQAIEPTLAVDHFYHGFAHHLRALKARSEGKTKDADDFFRKEITEYAAVLQQRQDSFWAYFNSANTQFELGNLRDAQIGYTACIRIRPDFPWPYNNRGTIHHRLGENELAVQDYDRAIGQDAEYFEALTNRGLAESRLRKYDLATSDLEQAIRISSDYAPAFEYLGEVHIARKSFAAAIDDYTHLLPLANDKVGVYTKRAAAYHAAGQVDKAIDDSTLALELDPKNVAVLYARAHYYLDGKDYVRAREDYTRLLTLRPKLAAFWTERGILNWIFLKDFDAALFDFQELKKLQPTNSKPYYNAGAIHLGRREHALAAEDLEKALELKVDGTDAASALSQTLLRQGDAERALEIVNRTIEKLADGSTDLVTMRGDIHRALGRLDAASADYRRVIELKPAAPEIYVSLALVCDAQGDEIATDECYERLVAANPESIFAYLRRAEFHRAHRRFAAALDDCARARQKDGKSVLPGLVEASVLAARGSFAEAVAKADLLLGQGPKDDGHLLYTAACVWSIASDAAAKSSGNGQETAKKYADRAVALLQQCLDKGFHDLSYPEHNRIADDPALHAIHRDPRVKALLAPRR
jgi:tetratricopeptide (TPR) repeat protein/tRNA A-37 threonylcarbamoyl transferase component Bud32